MASWQELLHDKFERSADDAFGRDLPKSVTNLGFKARADNRGVQEIRFAVVDNLIADDQAMASFIPYSCEC